MPGLAYDTAQVARLKAGQGSRFPRSVLWLLANQREDGSWGADPLYYPDRIISTLAAVVALTELSPRGYEKAVEGGVDYISRNVGNLVKERYLSVGFELLFPSLLEEADLLKLDVPPVSAEMQREQKKKLIVAMPLIYTGKTTLSFSVEFLSHLIDLEKAYRLIGKDGSVCNSPSATAYLLRYTNSVKSMRYLTRIEGINNDGSFVDVYPFEIFEKAWFLYNHILAGGEVNDQVVVNLNYLNSTWSKEGVGISSQSIPDCDDTAMVFKVLAHYGKVKNPRVFKSFELDDRFVCFPLERDPSISTNIHVLSALRTIKSSSEVEEMKEKVLRFLRNTADPSGFWTDKWNLSPYYATAHALEALSGLEEPMVERALNWILKTQNPNGSWGLREGNPEETAYAIQGLLSAGVDPYTQAVVDGLSFLTTYQYEKGLPFLWIGKGLYLPERVVESVLYATLNAFMKKSLG